MTSVGHDFNDNPAPHEHPIPAPSVTESVEAEGPEGNPAIVGVPTFVVGSIALGLVLTGYVSAKAVGASIPIIMTATGIGQIYAMTWAARLAQNAVAAVFGIFGGFWLSYAALVLGLTHGWFGILPADAVQTEKLFLLSWLIIIVVLTLVSLRLPLAFTAIFVLVDLALLFVLLGTANASAGETKTGGYLVFAFALVGVYVFADAMSAVTGGNSLPLGRPILH
jgi:succinate-acetate transporter protein